MLRLPSKIGLALVALAPCSLTPGATRAADAGTVIDAVSEEGLALRFRIDWTKPDPTDPDGEVQLYGVSVQAPGQSDWQPYCAPDKSGLSAAIPLSGSYSSTRPWRDSSDLTFACTSGAIGKCVRFGYKPWKTTKDGKSLRPYHEACVRMVRADYCGDGRAHTQNGTPIDVYDSIGVQSRATDDPSDPPIFEAGWSPDGATFLHRARWTDDLASIVAECPARLAGRVTAPGMPAPSATDVAARYPETLLLNDHYAHRVDAPKP